MWEVLSQSLMLISKRDTWCWTCHSYFRSQQSIKRVNNYCISTVFLSFCGSAVKDWYALAADVSPSVRPPFRCHISTNAVNTSVISVINTLRRWYCVDNSCSVTRDRPPPSRIHGCVPAFYRSCVGLVLIGLCLCRCMPTHFVPA